MAERPHPSISDDPHATEEFDASAVDTDAGDPFATFVPARQRQAKCEDRQACYDALVRGDQIGDFRIQRLLGRGSFGAVYLARELSLDRLVAVKVVMPEGQRATAGEGRSLARLRHPNIVGVYGEAHDRQSGCSLLWMQYVDGTNLASLIPPLHESDDGSWNEADLLQVLVDPLAEESTPIPADGGRGSIEMICRLGTQMAEALAHAHHCGIAHRDIKPANILMERDATPLLADFNMADSHDPNEAEKTGGTLAYMPPEQLKMLLEGKGTVNARRADIYSLGMVLWELAFGCRPYAAAESKKAPRGSQGLRQLAEIRSQPIPPRDAGRMVGLEIVLRRALAPDPCDRFPSAKAMATALKGMEELQRARRQAPAIRSLFPFFRRHLFWIILLAGLLPHFAASVIQSMYNLIWIRTDEDIFIRAFIAYNVVVYPACIGWLAWNFYRFATDYRRVIRREPMPRGQLRRLRMRLLRLPRQFMVVAAFGWFPGVVMFPWLLGNFGPALSGEAWMHYGISFALAGLIATTYSYALVLYFVGVHGYRTCWQTATHYRDRARYELAGMEQRVGRLSILVGTLPLAAAVLLLLFVPPTEEQIEDLHHLAIALIITGGTGLYLVVAGSARLTRVVRALTLSDE